LGELTAFFANTAAATQAFDPGTRLHYLRTTNPTNLENLALVCGRHHRMLHEDGWTLERTASRWVAKPPSHRVATKARSA